MITIDVGGYRVEAAAVPEADGSCCVTAEVFHGRRMVRSYYRRVEVVSGDYAGAERAVAGEVARMSSEAE